MEIENLKPTSHTLVTLPRFDLFGNLKRDFHNGLFSWIGRYEDFALGYLTFASVLHAASKGPSKPVGSFTIGKTSTGKTQFLEALCQLFPKERILNLTTSSNKSWIYECQENPSYLHGKVVFIEELAGIKNPEIQYLLRVLLTKGYAVHNTVVSGKPVSIEVFGEISLQSTGLDGDVLREDTMNRLVIFNSDDSEERTAEVIDSIVERYSLDNSKSLLEVKRYRKFFENLQSYPVSIPYYRHIKFETSNYVSRRLSKIFMDLLSTVALLNQRNRKIVDGVLQSDFEDLEILMEITRIPALSTTDNLNSHDKKILSVIRKFFSKTTFTYADIMDKKIVGPSKNLLSLAAIKRSIYRMIDYGLIEGSTGIRPAVFSLAEKAKNRSRFGVEMI